MRCSSLSKGVALSSSGDCLITSPSVRLLAMTQNKFNALVFPNTTSHIFIARVQSRACPVLPKKGMIKRIVRTGRQILSNHLSREHHRGWMMKTRPICNRILFMLVISAIFLSSCSLSLSPDSLFTKTRYREPFVPTPSPPYFLPGDCRFPVPPGEVRCGDLYVQEDRSNPNSRVVSLHVAIFPSYSPNPEPDPVIYLVGGGGSDTLGAAEFFLGTAGTMVRTKRDFILYNQRGVKRNDPYLACPGEAEFQTKLNRFVHTIPPNVQRGDDVFAPTV